MMVEKLIAEWESRTFISMRSAEKLNEMLLQNEEWER